MKKNMIVICTDDDKTEFMDKLIGAGRYQSCSDIINRALEDFMKKETERCDLRGRITSGERSGFLELDAENITALSEEDADDE